MGIGKMVGGVFKLGVAALAVAGVCSLFKDEIRETETYKKANEKYDVDTKVQKATAKVKSTTLDAAKKVSETAKNVKEKWSAAEDEAVADSEIILDEGETGDREYVSLDGVADAAADVAKEAEEAVSDAAAAAENIEID